MARGVGKWGAGPTHSSSGDRAHASLPVIEGMDLVFVLCSWNRALKALGISQVTGVSVLFTTSPTSVRLYFWGAPKSLQMVTAAMKLKDTYSLEEKL